jgi:peptide-methionine (R)-S-oxide reductase
MLTWTEILHRAANGNPAPANRVELAETQWLERLPAEVYRILRQKATERPFHSDLCQAHESGRYLCAGCGTLLFDSTGKFDSGTGWPSFTEPADPAAVAYHLDRSHGMERVETTCNSCGGHLGHVFPDGPPPSRLRFCINGLALTRENMPLK